MHPLRRRFAACLLFLAASTIATAAPAQERLRWKFNRGDTTRYQIAQTMDMKMSVMGQNVNSKMDQTMDMSWTVDSVAADGTATLRQKITRVQMKMSAPPFLNVEYDSDTEEQPDDPVGGQFARIFGAIVGEEFTLKMSPRGEVSDVELPEELEQALEGAGGGLPGGGGFTKDSLKQLSQTNLSFPAEPVSRNQQWTSETEVGLPFGTMKMDNQFTYQGTEQRGGRTLHKIGLKPKMAIEADADSEVQLSIKSQDGDGTIYFDGAAGRIAESTLKQKMEMGITAGGQAISQTLDQTVTMKMLPARN